MKTRKLWLGMLVMTLVFGMILISCPAEDDDSPTTYTVWTDTISYSEYSGTFGSLSDGYYKRYEFTTSEWNSIKSSLTSEGRHDWTEDELKKWFVGRGFGNSEANQETAWLVTISHGFIASRSSSLVYMILK